MDPRGLRRGLAIAGVSIGMLGLSACGGDDSGDSGEATVGACIDAGSAVVDCGSADAVQTLVSDQSAEDAIACVVIGDSPQTEVTVDGKQFCAEDK